MRICTLEPAASPHVDITRGMRKKVAGNEPRFLFLDSLDCVDKLSSCTVCFIFRVEAGAMVKYGIDK